ncbi:MAG: iron chelate uptake ABC transporter family permease subunit [Thermoguttaceae bacterium]|nr:iron chelate uptake ABC transporter family permease subunit [Thermoguttaceae bacterium]
MSAAPVLRVDALRLDSGEGAPILRGVSFDVVRGERVALVGVNGAGKTSTLRCSALLAQNWTGSIALNGRSVRLFSRRELAQKVAVVRQINDGFAAFTARQVVEFGRLPYLKPLEPLTDKDAAIVQDALERVDALQFADRRLDSLSGGERQKVLIAAAFAQTPELLLLDEPAAFLDYQKQAEIADAVALWLRDKGAAAIETTHDLNRAALVADRIVALREGSVVYDGPASLATSDAALEQIYGTRLTTVPHPTCDVPMILPDKPTPAPERQRKRDDASKLSTPVRKKHDRLWLAIFLIAALAILFVAPLIGKTTYSPDVWLRFPSASRPLGELDAPAKIFWIERLPKTLLAALAGSGLALAGLAMQTLFRNPLATPYTLGVASGASFGATLTLVSSGAIAAIGIPSLILGTPLSVWGAALGALLATSLVYALSRKAGSDERVLLAGVAIGFLFSSLVLCAQFLTSPTKAFAALRWTIGGFEYCEPRYLTITSVVLAASALLLYRYSRELDALTLGDEYAKSIGVDADLFRKALFGASSILVGVIVSFCGPIGFVGLTVPHAARLCVGCEHRQLIPASLLGGALFLAACHTFARIAIYPSVLPVGIVTSLLGGPFFIVLLLRRK